MRPAAAARGLGAFLLAVLLLVACNRAEQPYHGVDVSGMDGGGDFTLTAHDGGPFRPGDLRGKVVLIFFGYTHCPDICSPALLRLARLMDALGARAEGVQVLFVTVDPERDSPGQLAGFVPRFHPRFIGLTGSPEEIRRVTAAYRVAYERRSDRPGMFVHSGSVFVLDGDGRLRLMFRDGMPVAEMAADLKRILAEGA